MQIARFFRLLVSCLSAVVTVRSCRYRAHTVRIGTWNTQWANPRGARGDRVRTVLADPGCDILCVTEGSAGLLPTGGHIIDAGTDWGYLRRPLSTLGRDSADFGGRWTTVHVWFALDTSGARPVWHLTECDVGLDQSRMEDYKEEYARDDTDRLANSVRWRLGDAFRTCLGLGDSGGYPGSSQIRESELDSFDS